LAGISLWLQENIKWKQRWGVHVIDLSVLFTKETISC
jgi:hypothetical protein